MNRTQQPIRIRLLSRFVGVLAVAVLSAPALADESLDAGWMTAVLDGWGGKKVTAAAAGARFWVDRNERIYITGNSYFADQSHFHRATCEFSMEVREGSRRIQKASWGYQTGYWQTKTSKTKRTMSFAANRLTPGRHYLDLILKARLNGKTRTDTATLVVDVW